MIKTNQSLQQRPINGRHLLAAGVCVLLAACGGEPEFTVKDVRETEGNRVIERIRQDNRNGSDVLRQDVKLIKNYRNSISISLNGRKQINEARVREKILAQYKLVSESSEQSKTCVVPVEVPGGRWFEYDHEWVELLREGTVNDGAQGQGDQLGTYRILVNLNCQVVDQRVLN